MASRRRRGHLHHAQISTGATRSAGNSGRDIGVELFTARGNWRSLFCSPRTVDRFGCECGPHLLRLAWRPAPGSKRKYSDTSGLYLLEIKSPVSNSLILL